MSKEEPSNTKMEEAAQPTRSVFVYVPCKWKHKPIKSSLLSNSD